jgi:hypothetical protein
VNVGKYKSFLSFLLQALHTIIMPINKRPSDAICVKMRLEMRKDAARDAERCVKMRLEMRKDA